MTMATVSAANPPLAVWFMPAGQSPDTNDLFTKPEEWAKTRSLISAFVFSPGQVQPAPAGHDSLLADLSAVDAFRVLKTWGMKIALGVPALKEWDCTGRQTAAIAIAEMKTVYNRGGTVQYLGMDEPLISALGLNKPICHLDINEAAAIVAKFARTISADPTVRASGTIPEIIDTEAYPSLTVEQIKSWIDALLGSGFKPAAFDLDVNVNYVNIHRELKSRLSNDLQNLQKFLRKKDIPFGIIIWSGYDPLRSDKAYYEHAMDWVRIIHDAIGRPDRVIFASWVTRCSLTESCRGPKLKCSRADPAYCNKMSVPLNLPENGQNAFSHTRLVMDGTKLLMEH